MKDEWTGIELKKAINRTKEINKELKIDLINDCKELDIEYEGLKVIDLRKKLVLRLYQDLHLPKEDIEFIVKKPTEKQIEEYINNKKTKATKKIDADLELFRFLGGRKNK